VVQSIELPESAQTVGALLDEMYETYNSTTGSLFTNFALRPEIEKEQAMTQLLELFIACDKVLQSSSHLCESTNMLPVQSREG
jgi:hypothetical protein